MLTLIIGGSGSGKSAFAEAHVCKLPGKRIYLATMQPFDDESRARISRHRMQRAALDFETTERYCDLASLRLPNGANVLLEDLSNLLANEMYSPASGGAEAARKGLVHLMNTCENLTVVTNEVFSSGSDYAEESLRFMRQLAGLNRELARRADLAIEVVCGLPNVLKGELA